jgi:hypothetical protein
MLFKSIRAPAMALALAWLIAPNLALAQASGAPSGGATAAGQAQLHADNGVAGTGLTPPSGGSGILGYLSGVYHALTGTLTVQISGVLPDTSAGALAATAGAIGAPGSTVCASDTAACNQNAQLQRALQRLSTLIANTGSPFQAGGSIGNTAFGITGPLPDTSGGALAAISTNTSATNTDIGAPGSTPCATDTGSCSLNALAERIAQRLTTLNGTLGSPYQAGGALPLPTGASTSANQVTELSDLSSIITNTTGAATAANQATANSSLATIAANTSAALGQSGAASGSITTPDVGSTSAAGQNSVSVLSGSPTANSYLAWTISGASAADFTVTGTFSGALQAEGSFDGTNYVGLSLRQRGSGYSPGAITGPGLFSADVTGMVKVRLRATALASGSAVVNGVFSAAPGMTQITNPVRLFDNGSGQQAAIKAPSTPPAATDPALVVADYQDTPFQGAVAMTTGTTYASQRSLGANCTAAGNLSLTLADGSTLVVPVSVGWQTFPLAVTAVNSSGTTATCNNSNLK